MWAEDTAPIEYHYGIRVAGRPDRIRQSDPFFQQILKFYARIRNVIISEKSFRSFANEAVSPVSWVEHEKRWSTGEDVNDTLCHGVEVGFVCFDQWYIPRVAIMFRIPER